jgi:hypothetical protein
MPVLLTLLARGREPYPARHHTPTIREHFSLHTDHCVAP